MTTTAEPAITVSGMSRRFGATQALDRVDLEVPAGEVFALLGPNGSGKTTLIRILATLLRPDAGRATVLGHEVVQHAAQVRRVIGLTAQSSAVDERLTGRENLRMFGQLFHLPRKAVAQDADDLLDAFGLSDAADRPARTYSGGMRRRLDLASSLVTQPQVLFLDEPTTGLDPRSRNQIWQVVRDVIDHGRTVLLTTQYLEEADRLATNIAIADRGHIVIQGSAHELKDRVGGPVVRVRLTEVASEGAARSALERLGRGTLRATDQPDTFDLPVASNGAQDTVAVATALSDAGVAIDELSLRRPTMDDAFLLLTDAGTDQPTPAPRADGLPA